jgi:hypothetical protein
MINTIPAIFIVDHAFSSLTLSLEKMRMAANGCNQAGVSGEWVDPADGDWFFVEVIGRTELKGDGVTVAVDAKDNASLADSRAIVALIVAAGVVHVRQDA